jgi:hypothetical protein
MKGTDWLKAHPAMLVAGSLVDRNAVFSLDVERQATRNPTHRCWIGRLHQCLPGVLGLQRDQGHERLFRFALSAALVPPLGPT